jgi:hypothetical protein
MAKIIVCDACKKAIKHDHNHPIKVTDLYNNKVKSFDLCEGCYHKIMALLNAEETTREVNKNGN